jgi:hypothetical protein
MKLIDKAAVVAEIDEIVKGLQKNCNPNPMGNIQECLAAAQIEALNLIKDFLDTFETKEVDLEKEVKNLIEKEKAFVTDNREVKYYNGDSFNHIYELEFIAKHFFELGLKAQKGE